MATYTFAIANRGEAIFTEFAEYDLDHNLQQSGTIQTYLYVWTVIDGGLIFSFNNMGRT